MQTILLFWVLYGLVVFVKCELSINTQTIINKNNRWNIYTLAFTFVKISIYKCRFSFLQPLCNCKIYDCKM